MGKIFNLTGETFGQFYVIGPAPARLRADGHYSRCWKCRCTCGRIVETPSTSSLRSGNSTSCGICRRLLKLRAAKRPAHTRPDVAWQSEEIALLGTDQDKKIAQRIGRTVNAVTQHRRKLGIPPATRRRFVWTAETEALLGTAPDLVIGKKIGAEISCVRRRRLSLGITPNWGAGQAICIVCESAFDRVQTTQIYCSEKCRRTGIRERFVRNLAYRAIIDTTQQLEDRS